MKIWWDASVCSAYPSCKREIGKQLTILASVGFLKTISTESELMVQDGRRPSVPLSRPLSQQCTNPKGQGKAIYYKVCAIKITFGDRGMFAFATAWAMSKGIARRMSVISIQLKLIRIYFTFDSPSHSAKSEWKP